MIRQLIDKKEAGKILGVCKSVMDSLVYRNDFPAFKLGGKWKIEAELLDKWILQQMNSPKG